MAQLTQRRYNNIPSIGGVTQSVTPITPIVAPSTTTFNINGTLSGRPLATTSSGGDANYFGVLPNDPLQNQDLNVLYVANYPAFTNSQVPSLAALRSGQPIVTNDSALYYNLLYKPDASGASTVVQTGSGGPFAYTDYLLTQIDRTLKMTVSADNFEASMAGFQNVVDYYQLDGSSKGIKVPAGSYGSKVEADGNSYVRSSGGLERLAPRTYSFGTSANGNQTVIATDTFVSNTSKGLTIQGPLNTGAFSSKTYSISANTAGTKNWWETTGPAINYDYVPKTYSISAPSNFSYTSKVYSIR